MLPHSVEKQALLLLLWYYEAGARPRAMEREILEQVILQGDVVEAKQRFHMMVADLYSAEEIRQLRDDLAYDILCYFATLETRELTCEEDLLTTELFKHHSLLRRTWLSLYFKCLCYFKMIKLWRKFVL